MKPNNPSRGNPPTAKTKRQSRASAEPVPHPQGGRLVYSNPPGNLPSVEILLTPQQFWYIEEIIASGNGLSDLIPNTPAPAQEDNAPASGPCLKCSVCIVAAATLHLSQLKNEKLLKLDVCDDCAAAFHIFPTGESPAPAPPRAALPAAPGAEYLAARARRAESTAPSAGSPSAPPLPQARRLPAAPDGNYLLMVQARCELGGVTLERLGRDSYLNLPGLSRAPLSMKQLFKLMAIPLYQADDLVRAELAPRMESAWALVELEEMLLVACGVGERWTIFSADDGTVEKFYTRDRCGVLDEIKPSVMGLTVFTAFTLHYHARAVSEHVLPLLDLPAAASLADALVIAERIVWTLTDYVDLCGTPEKPTALQAQAWEHTARMWRDWQAERFSARPALPREANYLEKMNSKPNVAA